VLEMQNRGDMPGFAYRGIDDAVDIVHEVGSDRVQLLLDLYHLEIVDGSVLARLDELLPLTAHIQIADPPNRTEPGTGTLDWASVFAMLERTGYPGWIGCEYRPSTTTAATLGWAEPYGLNGRRPSDSQRRAAMPEHMPESQTSEPLIALISGTSAAIAPAASALQSAVPGVVIWNILDDRLLKEASARGGLTPELDLRMQRLIDHAVQEGADAVLLTCSMYGTVATESDASIPVLAADESVFAETLGGRFADVLVVATLEASRADTIARLEQLAAGVESAPTLHSVVPAGSFEATGDADALLASVVAGVRNVDAKFDAVMLAQYSLAPIAADLQREISMPVLAGPQAAAADLLARLTRAD
ncbi:TIM barrel protein, partial [Agrococcus casei]|uniref:TIM barrel protein n=1 Tax=Agrococcus casei TaxID=343512 RepID=UPI003F9225A7